MTRAVLKEKKIALKSPARALSNGAIYLFRQELLRGAIIESNPLSLHGHCVAIGMIMTLFFKIDTINRPTTHPKKSRSCLATYRNMLNKLSQIFFWSCLGKPYPISLVLYTRARVVLYLILTRCCCFSLSSGSCVILEACSCLVDRIALSLFCL